MYSTINNVVADTNSSALLVPKPANWCYLVPAPPLPQSSKFIFLKFILILPSNFPFRLPTNAVFTRFLHGHHKRSLFIFPLFSTHVLQFAVRCPNNTRWPLKVATFLVVTCPDILTHFSLQTTSYFSEHFHSQSKSPVNVSKHATSKASDC